MTRLHHAWPNVRLIVRSDAGFCQPLLGWCDRHQVDYVIGMAKNEVLLRKGAIERLQAQLDYQITQTTVQRFDTFDYCAGSWRGQVRRMVMKAEHGATADLLSPVCWRIPKRSIRNVTVPAVIWKIGLRSSSFCFQITPLVITGGQTSSVYCCLA